ncbi:hypothetical protein [Xanthomonas sp. LMG 8992]|uniref:hypothetical protein n=1 Tax=Xanthomonas sp. LMG 8992 TaxID=1591157 RepID=UPI00136A9DFC|nr:hypothetical protein [Xanthomonas sp. LMG 8992]
MKNVSVEIELFRRAGCDVWNKYLMPGENIIRLDVEESFEIIERELLRCLVLHGSPHAADAYRMDVIRMLVVKLNSNDLSSVLTSEEDVDGNVKWIHVGAATDVSNLDFRFFDFFDWNHYSKIQYDFVRCVEAFSGKKFLLPRNMCSFWLVN